MRRLAAFLVVLALVGCQSQPEPVSNPQELGGTYSGTFYKINYPKTFKVEPIGNGVRISGGFTIVLQYKADPKSAKGGVIPLQQALVRQNKVKTIGFNFMKTDDGLELVKMEGFDELERYTYGLFIPLDGGLLMLEQEPAYMRKEMADFAHKIAETLVITDFDWFKRQK
jgi:hypothetical protein